MSDIHAAIRGKVWKFGNSVDTNQLAGGGITVSSDPNENLKANCLRALRPEFPQQVKAGDLLVAGTNFGCGSSRQSAVQALQACGIVAVLAESVARIHRRNSIALALPTFVVPGITELVADGDPLEVDYPAGVVRNLTSGRELPLTRFPRTVEQIYELGGIFQVIADKLASQGIVPQ
ncbi:MAG: 3-isopropylmalate dehydratase small subunit [Betaproteobacteria bacterium]|nr:3-isopropylmalate dehydratase small subunit [Betaproteobacteria bacterium]